MNKNKIKLVIILIILSFNVNIIAQNYEFSLNPRRCYDKIKVEIWAKSLNPNAEKIGNASLVLQYNTAFLYPSISQDLIRTDSILPIEENSPNPYISINADFHNANGYNALTSAFYSADYYSLEINHNELGIGGLQPRLEGRGSFLGAIWFDIVGNPSESDVANIQWSRSSFPGNIEIFDINGNDIKSAITFTDADQSFRVIGITFLSPIDDNQVINRNAVYKMLEGAYFNAGYPIYFERSINPAIYNPMSAAFKNLDSNVAYMFEYSLDNGANWVELGRAAESDRSAKGTNYFTGQIFEPSGTNAFTITTATGQALNTNTFRLPLRVIWSKDPFFIPRSEQTRLRITQLNETTTMPILNRTTSNISVVAPGMFTLARLFFVQLDGVNNYFKTTDNYSNSTQLTVAAWVNLNSYKPAGTNPAIIASSGGPNATPVFGSNEGAWMLYLIDGRIPAFRCREILNRGNPATPNYLATVRAYAMDSLRVVPAVLNDAHANNWTHLAATVKDNVVSLYINGELVDQVTNNNDNDIRMLITNHPIWIGVNPNNNVTTNSFVNVGIKQVQVWRTALNQEQIRTFASGIVNPSVITNYGDIKTGLELYYTFDGTKTDLASNVNYQNGAQNIEFYEDGFTSQLTPGGVIPMENNSNNTKNKDQFLADEGISPNYRPDQPHLILTAPGYGAGVMNKLNDNTEIRWLTFGMTDLNSNSKLNFQIEYTIDDGETWTLAKNPSGQNLSGTALTNDNYEFGFATWQPYQNNVASANLRTLTPYSKRTQLRIKGVNANNDVSFISYSDTFSVAPLFSIKSDAGSQLVTERRVGMNITNDYAYIEAWIRPYRFPTDGEGFFPIAEKSDVILHYSFRLMSDGSLAFMVQNTDGVLHIARTASDFILVAPNSVDRDSAYTHCAVLFIRSNENNISEARFYIDGNLQKQLFTISGNTEPTNTTLSLLINNDYPLYIGSNPLGGNNSFIGEIREVRFWNNIPNDLVIYGTEPTAFTLFVQQSQAEAIDDLLVANKINLHSYFKLEGGTFFANGYSRIASISEMNGALLKNFGTPVRFVPFAPFIKLVEPQFRQSISNMDKDVKVRWVGMYYNGLNFYAGANNRPPSLEYSIRGGGGNEIQPYQYVGSIYFTANRVNSIKLPTTSNVQSALSNNRKYFGLFLDASMANPDVNGDGKFVSQGALSPVLTNARLRLTGNFTINGETLPLLTEGPLFSINPISNYTLRVMLEGYHQGNVAGRQSNNLGSEYDRGGLRIKLFTDNSGEIGERVGSDAGTHSIYGYTDRDPNNLNRGNMRFGNVDFIFTDVADGSYWVLVEHINHLPIMSRYPAPFQFTGNNPLTWVIESGWDFISWNGVDDNIMPSPFVNPWAGNYYSARGNAINSATTDPERYSTTGLIYNGGTNANNGLAAMVGGDVNQDGMINAADRVIVRQETGTQSYRSDITGDRFVNAVDRTIVDKNFGKVSSLLNTNIPTAISFTRNDEAITLNNENKLQEFTENNTKNNTKNTDQFLAFRYEVSSKLVYNDSGYVDLSVYIRNTGDAFAPANCTFPLIFDMTQVEFISLLGSDSVIFNSTFDYANIDKDAPENGYMRLYSAPRALNQIAYRDIRSIEIDYDAYANAIGINVPYQATYLGTLRFKIKQEASSVAFSWHESKAVLTTKGQDITNDGIWDSIPNILLYTGRVLQPNGGEQYSVVSSQTIKWTLSKTTNIFIEFSSTNGYTWQRLTDTAISSSSNEFKWVTPNINSNVCLVRIVDALTLIEIDRSDDVFSIYPPWGNILKPYASNEVNRGGTSTTIEWVSGGTSCVRFEFSSDGGISWSVINGTYNASTGKANWSFPRVTTTDAVVRMFDCESGMLLSTSGKFIILNGTITFTAPAQGQRLKANNDFKIRWNRQYVDMFDLDVSLDSGRTWSRVASDVVASDLNYNWLAPNINTDTAYFRALYQGNPTMEYGRSRFFRIWGGTYINELPDNSYISEVFPNPAKTKASIKLYFEEATITMELINIDGSKMLDIISNEFISGEHIIHFDLKNLPSGKYYVLIISNDFNVVREVLVGK